MPSLLRGALARHQLGAVVATAVDFAAMVAAVELLHLRPAWATALGAALGAVTNFTLGRRWIFDRQGARATPAAGQAARYALVSLASLALNALGVRLLAEALGVQFVLARVLVAALVSLGWNFPLHRGFVFSAAVPAKPRGGAGLPMEGTPCR